MNSNVKNERILILESDQKLSDELSNGLKREGYSVTAIRGGPEAFKAIYDVLPHLIVMNAEIAGASSYDILSEKQADPMIAKIPVMLISTQAEPLNMRRIPEGSVAEFIMSLHVEAPKLIEKINSYLGHYSGDTLTDVASGAPKKKILWIEDDRLIGTILSKKLVSSGFDLFHAKSGEEALEMIKSMTPDIIIVDLVLPNVSGFDVIAEIKKDTRVNNIPIMVLSNLSKQADVDHAKSLGVKKYLVKASASLDKIVEEIRGTCR